MGGEAPAGPKMGNITADNTSMNCDIDHTIHQTLAPVVYVMVLVVGFPANCLSLYYGYLQIKARNELGVYLCNLTVADLFYICSLPFWLQYVLQHDHWSHDDLSCQVCGILLYENIYISVGFLCCISIDRYLAVAHPFRFHQFRTLKAAVGVSALIWAKELLTSIYFLMHEEVVEDADRHRVCFEHYPLEPRQRGINYYRYLAVAHPFRFHQFRTLKAAVGVSVLIWAKELLTSIYFLMHEEVVEDADRHRVCFEHYPLEPRQRGINYYRFLVGFLFPICLLLASYRGILRAVRRSHGTQKSRKDQIQRLVLSTVVIFLACFLPYHVLLLVRSLWESSCDFAKGIFNAYHFSLLLTSFNCVADPVLYCFVSETTHRDLARLRGACLAFLTCARTGRAREAYPLGAPEASGKSEDPEVLTRLHPAFQTPHPPGVGGSPAGGLS